MAPADSEGIMEQAEAGRLRWRCRRGMRELDVVLAHYLQHQWPQAGAAERMAFRELLDRPDPEISGLLLGQTKPESEALARVLESLRRTT
jgi:antitoxin CptB